MAVFTPPTDAQVSPITDYWGNTPRDADPLILRMMEHFASGPRGRNVYLMVDGTITEQQPPNWDPTSTGDGPTGVGVATYAYSYTYAGGSQPANGVTTFTLPDSQRVKRIYWGGVANPVSASEVTALTAAGYGGNIT